VRTPEDKYRVGASPHVNIKGMGMGEFDFEVSESLENEKITYRAKGSRTNQPTNRYYNTLLLFGAIRGSSS